MTEHIRKNGGHQKKIANRVEMIYNYFETSDIIRYVMKRLIVTTREELTGRDGRE